MEVSNVEKPRSVIERARERKEAPPADRRGPGAPQQGSRQQGVERGGKPGQAIPQEKAKPERPQSVPERGGERVKAREAPAEKVKPGEVPLERGKMKETPVQKVKPREAPIEKGRPKEEPTEKVTREPQRRGDPGDRVGQGGKPMEKAKPERPQPPQEKEHEKVRPRETPADNVMRDAPRGRPGREEGREDRR